MSIYEQIRNYTPYNGQEEKDKEVILKLMEQYGDIFSRKNEVCHMTASAWIVNPAFDRILMAYHNIYKSWSWLGGHADEQEDLLKVALKEVKEESGIQNVKAVSEEIFSLETLSVDSHYKKGKYVPTHLHLNVTYLVVADDREETIVKEDENSDVKWFNIEEAVSVSNEEWFKEHIYSKLNEKLKAMLKEQKYESN